MKITNGNKNNGKQNIIANLGQHDMKKGASLHRSASLLNGEQGFGTPCHLDSRNKKKNFRTIHLGEISLKSRLKLSGRTP